MFVAARLTVMSSFIFKMFFLAKTVLLPRRQTPTALHNPIEIFLLIQVITSLYCLFCVTFFPVWR